MLRSVLCREESLLDKKETTLQILKIKMREQPVCSLTDEFEALQKRVHVVYSDAPKTTDAAVKMAEEALKIKGVAECDCTRLKDSALREQFIAAYNQFVRERPQGHDTAALQSVVAELRKEESDLAELLMQRLITESAFRAEQRRIKAQIEELNTKINEQRGKIVHESDFTIITEFDPEKVEKFITKVIVRKVTAVGNSKYTSKYPFSGLLICGECGHKLRRHVRRVGSGLMVPAWGCSNRISNGRAQCDSHHVNEDTLQNTYTAAIRDMIEDAEEIMAAVKESAGLVMEPENRAALERIEQEIIDLQNAVLELHKAKQQRSVTAADYAAQIKEYSQRMQELEAQQAELQTTENRYGEVKMWLDSFAEHIQSGAIMDADDSMIMKQLVEQIIVNDDGIEVHFKCGIVASHEYM